MLLAITDTVEPSFVIIIKGFDNPSYSTTYMTLSSWDLVHETSYSLAAKIHATPHNILTRQKICNYTRGVSGLN